MSIIIPKMASARCTITEEHERIAQITAAIIGKIFENSIEQKLKPLNDFLALLPKYEPQNMIAPDTNGL